MLGGQEEEEQGEEEDTQELEDLQGEPGMLEDRDEVWPTH